MRKFFRYLQHRVAFARHDPRLPNESQVTWCEWLVLAATGGGPKPLVALHPLFADWYGWLGEACSAHVKDIVEDLEERGLVYVWYNKARPHKRIVRLTPAGADTLECYPNTSGVFADA